MGRWTKGQMDGWREEYMNGSLAALMDGWMDGWIEGGYMDGSLAGLMDGWIYGCMDGRMELQEWYAPQDLKERVYQTLMD